MVLAVTFGHLDSGSVSRPKTSTVDAYEFCKIKYIEN
jgi:hypothetical protein